MENCLFCKISNGNGSKVFENEEFVIIKDINPAVKLHYLLMPKKHYDDIVDFVQNDPEGVSRAFKLIAELKDELGLTNGFRVVTNKGADGGQTVGHIHIHILGGESVSKKMGW